MNHLWQGMTRLLEVYDGNNALLMRFEYADARMPVAMTAGGVKYYLAYDQVGTLKAVADASGNVIKKIEYDTFGNILSDSNPAFAVPFGFAGGLYDRDTKLVRFGYRDYDPETGRWTAKDPILFAGGDTNLYGYCLNDPINFVDPPGLESLGESIGRQVQWYVYMGGIRSSDRPVSYNLPSPCVAKCAAVIIGLGVGAAAPGWVPVGFWAADSLIGFLDGGPVPDHKLGIEWINPPDAGTGSEDLYIDYYNNPNPFFTPFYIKINCE